MAITNDVALIAFVPFGLTVLRLTGQERLVVPQVVLQTIAANLGSMLTPMGTSKSLPVQPVRDPAWRILRMLLPYVLAAALCLAVAVALIKPVRISGVSLSAALERPRDLLYDTAGFVLCLLGFSSTFPSL